MHWTGAGFLEKRKQILQPQSSKPCFRSKFPSQPKMRPFVIFTVTFYEAVESTFKAYSRYDINIIQGDFNSQMGTDPVIRRYFDSHASIKLLMATACGSLNYQCRKKCLLEVLDLRGKRFTNKHNSLQMRRLSNELIMYQWNAATF